MPNLSSLPRPVQLRSLLGGVVLALALLAPASASAWVKEAAPAFETSVFDPEGTMAVLPDGTLRYIAMGPDAGGDITNRLVVRPPAGPAGFAPPFPAALGQDDGFTGFLELSPQDAAGNQLVVRDTDPFAVGFLSAGSDTAAAVAEPVNQVTAIDLAPSGEAAAIVSSGSEASVRFRPAGPAGRFDTPRPLDRAGKMFSYAIGITIDPDGGILAIYRTQQTGSAILQAYAPPGGNFGAPQLIDVPESAISLSAYRYGQSSNGHAVFAWDESTGGDTNSEEIWAVTRAPGGLLGPKQLVATARPGGLVDVNSAAATDDGHAYVNFLDAGTIVCPSPNNYREGGSVLARRNADGSWTKLNPPSAGGERDEILGLASAGNAIGVLTRRSVRNDKCTDKDPASELKVQLGQGGSPGPAQLIVSENITNGATATMVYPREFAINAGGAAGLLVEEPTDSANNRTRYLYYQGGAPGTPPPPPPAPGEPLKAPGKITLSGSKLTARGDQTDFLASCTRLPGEGSTLFCSISALLLLEEKLKGKAKSSTAGASAKGKGKAKVKVIATAKPVKVPVGTSKKITLKLNKLGKQKLAAAKKAGLKATLKVTISRAGYATNTIEKKVKLVSGKAKGKGNKGGRK